ncbi:LOW QUALITY PROTEIN: forkhead box protein P2-like [Hypomesus transpacificus]|uniref:LOW QUALITY PROTEIN: forkhead box protein P2-like n=1 Tax=Hypomesus transpacificus TaxID=137520 RepID=UPI001F07C7D8|nr:LOW QUALITY PROTEIN: forkhead box protein P2-like [Hypomesus transpacificus]
MSPHPVHHVLTHNQIQRLLQQQQAMMLHQQHMKDFYKQQQQQIYLQLLQQKNPEKRITEPSLQQLLFQQLLQLQHQQQLGQLLLPSHTLAPGESRGTSPDCTNSTTTSPSTPSTTSVNLAQEKSQPPRRTECFTDVDHSAIQRLYSHGVCNWPGCDCVCENMGQFVRHLGNEHTLDARSTAQCRVQMQVVQQLDLQLSKERERLQAMMAHLHLPPEPQTPSSCLNSVSSVSMLRSQRDPSPPELPQESPPPAAAPDSPLSLGLEDPTPPYPATTPSTGALRLHPPPLPLSSDTGHTFELYENADIRPPYTYATLIRQAIVESPDLQLTLSEVYSWFTRTFAYFRRNAATWKNAVRHNLSLHKCFVRVENVKGAVWMVDEEEYLRRRSQKISGSPVVKPLAWSLPYGTTVIARAQTALAEAAAAGTRRGDPGTRRGDPGCISSSCQETQDSDPPSRPGSPPHAQRPIMEDQECLSMVTTNSPDPQQDAELEEGQLSDLD